MPKRLGKVGQPTSKSASFRSIKQARPKAHRNASLVRLGERPRVKRAVTTIDLTKIRPRPSVATMLDNVKGDRL